MGEGDLYQYNARIQQHVLEFRRWPGRSEQQHCAPSLSVGRNLYRNDDYGDCRLYQDPVEADRGRSKAEIYDHDDAAYSLSASGDGQLFCEQRRANDDEL